jgi:MFS family permease
MAQTLRPVAALLAGIAFLLAGNGLQVTLTPLAGEAAGFDAVALGIMGSAYYVGFVCGCLLGPFMIVRAGHIRAFAAMVSAASAVALVHPLLIHPIVWDLLRAITGFCLAGLYLIIESWLNDRATNQNRGFIMSAYIVVNFATLMVGQMMVTLYPVTDFAPFALASILVSIAAIPVALTKSAQPAPIALVRFRPRELLRVAPVGVVGAFMVGIANGSFWALGPVYGTGSGLSVRDTAIFMSVAVAAGALSQWPVGRLSDKIDRRVLLAVLLVLSAGAGIALWLTPRGADILLVLSFLFGALTLPGYSLAAAHAYDKTKPGGYVETAAGILLVNGLGSIIGPSVAALVIARMGPSGLFLFTAVVQLSLAVFVVFRISVRASTAAADKTGFDLASTAPMGAVITPELVDASHPMVVTPEEVPGGADRAG